MLNKEVKKERWKMPANTFRMVVSVGDLLYKSCVLQDCEAIWKNRDNDVQKMCSELGITVIDRISHTLWDPLEIIETNGGFSPTTYEMFVVRNYCLSNSVSQLISYAGITHLRSSLCDKICGIAIYNNVTTL